MATRQETRRQTIDRSFDEVAYFLPADDESEDPFMYMAMDLEQVNLEAEKNKLARIEKKEGMAKRFRRSSIPLTSRSGSF